MRRGLMAGVVGLCVASAAPLAHAQGPQIRMIEQGAERDWKHERSGVVFPANLLGIKREAVQDTTDNEYDVFARYSDGSATELVSVYVYQPAVMSVPLWFDRAQAAITLFQSVDSPKAATIFAPPGNETASAMRVSYPMPGGAAGTALAMVPVGDWLLKIRITAPGTPEAVESRIDEILAALALPEQPDAPLAADVQPCAEPLKYGKAKALKPNAARVMLVAAMTAVNQEEDSNQVWCREGQRAMQWGLYRRAGSSDGYLLALADSGRALQVEAVPPMDMVKKTDFAMTFTDGDQIHQFPQLSALPSPQQAIELTGKLRPVASYDRSTKAINLMLDEILEHEGSAKGK